jgi:hypothetical protein
MRLCPNVVGVKINACDSHVFLLCAVCTVCTSLCISSS